MRFTRRLTKLECMIPPVSSHCATCAPLRQQRVWLSREPVPWRGWPLVQHSGSRCVYQCPACHTRWPVETVRIAPQLTPPPAIALGDEL